MIITNVHKALPIKNSYGILKGKVWVSDDFDKEDPEINKMFYGELLISNLD